MSAITRIKYINHVSPDGYKIRISKKIITTSTRRQIRVFVDETNNMFWIQDIVNLEFLAKGKASSRQMTYIRAREALATLGVYVRTAEAKKGVVRKQKKIESKAYLSQLAKIAEQEGEGSNG